jgi:hypothetical protein
MRKHGPDNFTIVVMDEVATREEAAASEISFIKAVGSRVPCGYNMTDGGDGARGYRHTEKWKQELSRRQKGCIQPPEAVARMRISLTGRKLSEAHVAKCKARMTGTTHTAETKQQMAESAKTRWIVNPRITSPEESERLRTLAIGRVNTPEHNAAISKANKGVVRTPENRERSRIAALARHVRERAAKEAAAVS